MAVITNTVQTYALKGIREDLTDVIWNISPMETPFCTSIGRAKATNTLHEWQTDALAAASTSNAQIEGDDVAFDTITATVRLGNYTQISRKTVLVSGTAEAVLKAGRKSELAYQVAKKGKELRRDIEAILLANQAKAVGSASVARTVGGVLSWIKTNTDKGATGADPTGDGSNTRTDGTQRAFVESSLKTVLAGIFTNSSEEPDIVLLGAALKQEFSTFTGSQTRFGKVESKELVNAIDVYVYDFGEVKAVPDRFMRVRDALVLNTGLWAMGWLRPIRLEDLAKTGDATKKWLVGEYTLESRNEAGSGGVFDLQ